MFPYTLTQGSYTVWNRAGCRCFPGRVVGKWNRTAWRNICVSIHPHIHRLLVLPSVSPFIPQSVHPSIPDSILLSVCPSIHLFISPSTHPLFGLLPIHPFIFLSIPSSIHWWFQASTCLSIPSYTSQFVDFNNRTALAVPKNTLIYNNRV